MPKITIDNIEYNTEDLTENGKAQPASLQFLEGQMKNCVMKSPPIKPRNAPILQR
ncbi:hypothetical protein OE810_08900 [Rhodobacteraceae bacterium XHP0102]|nr:hypothetical protein [Rhodobacteraceae bacterium XHP0102]